MPRHDSVTDDFVEGLDQAWHQLAEAVRSADSWPETQKLMVCGTYAFQVAINRLDEGWSKEEIWSELEARTFPLRTRFPIKVTGTQTLKITLEQG